jgi:hypothetical protein
VSFPLKVLLLTGAHRLQGDELVEAIDQRVAVWTPSQRVDGLFALDEVSTKIAILRPYFEGAILTGRGEGSSIIAPLE